MISRQVGFFRRLEARAVWPFFVQGIAPMQSSYMYTPYIWPMLASAVFMAGLAVYAWKHRSVPGAGPFVVQMLSSASWAVFAAVEIAASDAADKFMWFKIERTIAPVPVAAMLFFALEYTRPSKPTARRWELWLSAPLLFVLPLLATNDLHHLYWSRLWFDGFVRFEPGLLNAPVIVYILSLPTLALLIFLRLVLESRGIFRGQALVLLTGNALPLVTFLVQRTGVNPVAPLDPTILMLNLSGLLFTLAVYRFGMLSVIPVGRETAMDRMADGFVILDGEKRIVDLNPAAEKIVGLPARRVRGQPATRLPVLAPVCARLDGQGTASSEITFGTGPEARHYDLNISRLKDPRGSQFGYMLLLRDNTEQRRAQALLVEQQRALATLAERERLARELHDGLGQVLGYVKLMAQTARELLAEDQRAAADSDLAMLMAVAQDAHDDVRDYILAAGSATVAGAGLLPGLRQYLARFQEHYRVRVELTVPPGWTDDLLEPTVETQLLRIIQEALNNVRKHAQAQAVQVRLELEAQQVQVTVQDDGAGFDPARSAEGEGHYGLGFMRDRVNEVGGTLLIDSAPGRGTRVVICVPRRNATQTDSPIGG